MSKILGGRHEEEWTGALSFPLKDGTVYELHVTLQALYSQDETRIVSRHARRAKRGTGEYLSMADSVEASVALLNYALVDWHSVNGNRDPVGHYCTKCDRWVLTDREAKLYEIDHCRCDEPEVDPNGRQYPCKHPWPRFVTSFLQANVDDSAMPTDDDGDPMTVSSVIIERARGLASGGGDLSGEAEGN